MDIPRDKSEITGCYHNEETSSVIQIAKDIITLNGQLVYERYEYGTTGRRNLPTIVAWPGTTFVYDGDGDGQLTTGTWGDGEGPLNFTFVGAERNKALEIPTFPNGIVFYFARVPC